VTVEVKLWPQVREDFRALPNDALRWEALKYIGRLREEPKLGLPLHDHPILGDLSDCRKLFLDDSPPRVSVMLLIYRLLPGEDDPKVADEASW